MNAEGDFVVEIAGHDGAKSFKVRLFEGKISIAETEVPTHRNVYQIARRWRNEENMEQFLSEWNDATKSGKDGAFLFVSELERIVFGQASFVEPIAQQHDADDPDWLFLRLGDKQDELILIPWELMMVNGVVDKIRPGDSTPYANHWGTLAPELVIVRESLAKTSGSHEPPGNVLRVLVHAAEGFALQANDQAGFNRSIDKMARNKQVELVQTCNQQEFFRILRDGDQSPFDVVVIVGHGVRNSDSVPNRNRVTVNLDNAHQTESGWVSMDEVGRLLVEAKVKAVFFAVCHSASTSEAAALAVPVVVGAHRSIAQFRALDAAAEFVTILAADGLGDAISASRRCLDNGDNDLHQEHGNLVFYVSHVARGLFDRSAFKKTTSQALPPAEANSPLSGGPRFQLVGLAEATPKPQPLVDWFATNGERAVTDQSGADRPLSFLIGPRVLQVSPQVEEIFWDAALASSFGDAPLLASFVEAVRLERSGGRTVQLKSAPDDLTTTRVALARLSYEATALYRSSLAASHLPVTSWTSHAVRLPSDSVLCDLMDEAVAAIQQYRTPITGGESDLLGAVALRSRLKLLRTQLAAGTIDLDGEIVDYLTDLFWHAMIFDSPLYSTTEELAIQVSLLSGAQRPLRRVEPHVLVERHQDNGPSFERAVAKSIERGFQVNESSGRRQLFRDIGRLQFYDYDRWLEAVEPGGAEEHASEGRVPIVLSTNLDLEAERGMAEASKGHPFHVVLPVFSESRVGITNPRAKSTDGILRWLIGTFEVSSANPTTLQLSAPSSGWRLLAALSGESLVSEVRGPILVKCNGSPLHNLPTESQLLDASSATGPVVRRRGGRRIGAEIDRKKEAVAGSRKLFHAIAFGEYDILQINRITLWGLDRSPSSAPANEATNLDSPDYDGLPNWFGQALRSNHRFWFLSGVSEKEWSTRILIHTYLGQAASYSRWALAVSPGFSEERLRLYEWLGVDLAQDPGEGLISLVSELADKREKA